MTAYFVSTDESDLAYLPEWARSRSDLDWFASQVEADVIRAYTRQLNDEWDWYRVNQSVYPVPIPRRPYEVLGAREGVFLYGFKVDASDADVDPYLKVAMKRTIAEVVVWRIRQVNVDPMLSSEASEKGKSKTYRGGANASFPPEWDRWLRNFSEVEPNWIV